MVGFRSKRKEVDTLADGRAAPTLSGLTGSLEGEEKPKIRPDQSGKIQKLENTLSTALIHSDEGYLYSGNGMRIHPGYGLELPPSIDKEQYDILSKVLCRTEEAIQLAIGDMVIAGIELGFYKSIAEWCEEHNANYSTVSNYVRVSNSADKTSRGENLLYGHYRLVAGETYNERRHEYLRYASENNLTYEQFNQYLNPRQPRQGDMEKALESLIGSKRAILRYAKKVSDYERDMIASQLEEFARELRSIDKS